MSILIKDMDMPKQTEAQTDKGMLKLWTIRNWKVGQDVQFGAAKIPCDLSFNHDGTIHLSVLGRNYSLSEIPTPHGDLIDRNTVINRALNLGTSHDPIVSAVIQSTIKVLLLAVGDIPAVINAEGENE